MSKARLVFICLILSVALLPVACEARYTALDLGTLGGRESWAMDVNKQGAVVGCSLDREGRQRAFLWTTEKGMVDLGTLGGDTAVALGIYETGEIVGYSTMSDGTEHAFLWTTEQSMVDLGTLPGDASSKAAAVADIVVGTSKSSTGAEHAFSWSVDTNMIALATLSTGADTHAYSINGKGVIAGTATDVTGNLRAVTWSPEGVIQDLGSLGGPVSSAFGLNEAGFVVGQAADASGVARPFCWAPESGIHQLPVPSGVNEARANSINSSNRIVGSVMGKQTRAVAWAIGSEKAKTLPASITVLPLLRGAVASEASVINDAGVVVGSCRTKDGESHATVWKPVKSDREPLSIALTGGFFAPVSADTRDKYNNVWWRVSLKPFERTRRTLPHFSLETGAFRLTGPTTARLYTLTFGMEKGLDPGIFAQPYVAYHVGPYWGRTQNQTTGVTDSKLGLSANAAYGLIFAKSFYAELRYDYFSRFSGTDFSGLSVSVGFRLFDLPR